MGRQLGPYWWCWEPPRVRVEQGDRMVFLWMGKGQSHFLNGPEWVRFMDKNICNLKQLQQFNSDLGTLRGYPIWEHPGPRGVQRVGKAKCHSLKDPEQLVQTGDRPYQCPSCRKRFSFRSHLIYHQKIHSEEQPHECPEYGKSFSYSSTLISPQWTHE
ncbi:zinc finger protein 776-like [Ammospiza caudacuta]|uniref:zinc finger protein 776-like n=1 Tax=Ammospiza caudacuta TaxID=2857398 RepID=UPI0027393F8D|nr:zinc finger protein 776-like [Ammospiza caudacuta]